MIYLQICTCINLILGIMQISKDKYLYWYGQAEIVWHF